MAKRLFLTQEVTGEIYNVWTKFVDESRLKSHSVITYNGSGLERDSHSPSVTMQSKGGFKMDLMSYSCFDDDGHVRGQLNITKVNNYFVAILNLWIIVPTNYTKLNVRGIKMISHFKYKPAYPLDDSLK